MSKVTDKKLSENLPNDMLLLRMYMSNLFDRNASFKEVAKECV